jgi:hypothetical protein
MSDTLNETVPGCTRELLATTLPMPYRAIILPCNIFMSLEGHIDNLARAVGRSTTWCARA